jgi:hypothetical protein
MKLSKPVIEASKEALRVVVLSILPVLITQVELGVLDYKVLSIVGLLALLKWLDKFLHEVGKTREDSPLTKGLTRF